MVFDRDLVWLVRTCVTRMHGLVAWEHSLDEEEEGEEVKEGQDTK